MLLAIGLLRRKMEVAASWNDRKTEVSCSITLYRCSVYKVTQYVKLESILTSFNQ